MRTEAGVVHYEWHEWYVNFLDIAIKAAEDPEADCNPWGGCAHRSMTARELRGLRDRLAAMADTTQLRSGSA